MLIGDGKLLLILPLCWPGLLNCTAALAAELDAARLDPIQSSVPGNGCLAFSALVYNTGWVPGPLPAAKPTGAPAPDGKDLPTPSAAFHRPAHDDGGFWNPALPTRFTVPADGVYGLRLRVNFQALPAGAEGEAAQRSRPPPARELSFVRNGRVAHAAIYRDRPHAGGYWPTLTEEVRLELAAGDFVEAASGVLRTEAAYGRIAMAAVEFEIHRLCD